MSPVDSLRTETKFKKTEIGEIPVDWELVKLGEIADIKMGQSPRSSSCYDYENGLPFFQGKAEFGPKYPRILKWCNAPIKIARKGDILISVRAPVGDINVAPEDSCIGRGLAAICAIKGDNEYLYYMLNFFKKRLSGIGQGSTFEAINKKDLHELEIPFPPFNEQKRIAQILILVDETIEKKQQIIEKTKELKKGLMKELLTRGIGHDEFIRTEIGTIPRGWAVEKLKSVGQIVTGNTPSTKHAEYYNGEYLWATPGDLGNGKYVKATAKMLTKEGIDNARIIPKNSILVGCMGSTIGKVAVAYQEMTLNQQINAIICNKEWDPHFVYYWMLRSSDALASLAGRHAVPIVNKTLLSSFQIARPTIEEQGIIGETLNSVDENIGLEVKRRKKLQMIKLGLMQILLTGKSRVSTK